MGICQPGIMLLPLKGMLWGFNKVILINLLDQWPVKNPARLTHESGRISEWDDGLEESHKIWIVIVVKGKGANQEWIKSWPGICESSTTVVLVMWLTNSFIQFLVFLRDFKQNARECTTELNFGIVKKAVLEGQWDYWICDNRAEYIQNSEPRP